MFWNSYLFLLKTYFFFILCALMFSLKVYLHHVLSQNPCHGRQKVLYVSLGTGIGDSGELPWGHWESN